MPIVKNGWSQQGLTRNDSLRSKTPNFLFDFLKHTPPDLFLKAFNSFRRVGESPSRGGPSWRAHAGSGSSFCRVSASPGSAPRPGKCELELGFSVVVAWLW